MFDDKIANITAYNANMRKTLQDKAFFLSQVEATLFVDVGCADGSLIEYMQALYPENTYIGYDISQRELELAKARLGKSVLLTNNWALVTDALKQHRGKTAIVCNSVIHEVYSYGNDTSIATFWDCILGAGADYIVVRDMCLSHTANRQADSVSIARVRKAADTDMLQDFESRWGSIADNKNLIHFLLKYRYKQNWKREVAENYLPLSFTDILQKFQGYNIEFAEQFTLPFLRKTVLKDFGVDVQEPTHAKIILIKTGT